MNPHLQSIQYKNYNNNNLALGKNQAINMRWIKLMESARITPKNHQGDYLLRRTYEDYQRVSHRDTFDFRDAFFCDLETFHAVGGVDDNAAVCPRHDSHLLEEVKDIRMLKISDQIEYERPTSVIRKTNLFLWINEISFRIKSRRLRIIS